MFPTFFFIYQIFASLQYFLLFFSPMAETHPLTPTPSPMMIITTPRDDHGGRPGGARSDWMVLVAAITCAFLCALGLNTMLQCVFQCATRVLTEPLQWLASRRLNSGLKKKDMVALPTSTYCHSSSGGSPSSSSASSNCCAICLVDFSDGDQLRFLPQCGHHFHVVCIVKWLRSHSSCPTCRHLLKSNDSTHSFHIVIS